MFANKTETVLQSQTQVSFLSARKEKRSRTITFSRKWKYLPLAIREFIVKLRKEGATLRKIAQMTNKSHSSVEYVVDRYNKTGLLQNRQRTGRPQKLETHHKRAILRTIRTDPRTSAPKLASMIVRELLSTRILVFRQIDLFFV
ncbi:hypothetical protein KPH14_012631 [Odynerus spinipes]|uniref:Transposase IS30-like HTH domain-containing protein n=1 Tax=Odynerus spinipes TaxID=1348599 RepID=A0AAD9VLL7_9HYME|nr:hypothetical protein KPH14_012631 [Odynerus spinipes]